jgi:signal transduction histidine kinase
MLILKIEDNGVGFQTRNNSKGNGLHNMQERAKKWNSPLHIISVPGKGTQVILEMKT